METHEYQPFFDGLLPRLETARTLQRELDSQLAQRFNVFDYLRTDELGLSRVIADLLNPLGRHGQGPVFLELLLRGLKLPFATSERLDHASVEVERVIKDGRRLDICVRIGNHCLAIENKPYAGDQPGQVDDYLRWLRSQEFESSLLIYLSHKESPRLRRASSWRICKESRMRIISSTSCPTMKPKRMYEMTTLVTTVLTSRSPVGWQIAKRTARWIGYAGSYTTQRLSANEQLEDKQ